MTIPTDPQPQSQPEDQSQVEDQPQQVEDQPQLVEDELQQVEDQPQQVSQIETETAVDIIGESGTDILNRLAAGQII